MIKSLIKPNETILGICKAFVLLFKKKFDPKITEENVSYNDLVKKNYLKFISINVFYYIIIIRSNI